jgi:hypothetical protein
LFRYDDSQKKQNIFPQKKFTFTAKNEQQIFRFLVQLRNVKVIQTEPDTETDSGTESFRSLNTTSFG